MVSSYEHLAKIHVLQKHSKFERMQDCNWFFILEKEPISNGWRQLQLRINSILLKK